MNHFKKAAVAASGAMLLLCGAPGAAVSATGSTWTVPISWGGEQRGTITFSNSGDESVKVKDTNSAGYGVYAAWDAGSKSGNCNATGGVNTTKTCAPLYLAENLEFYVVACSKNYSGGVLIDSHCNSRFSYGTS